MADPDRLSAWLQAARPVASSFRQYIVYLALVLILVAFSVILRDHGFLSWNNIAAIGRQAAPIAVMAVGMTFALAAGEIDLSVGSIVGISSLVAANLVAPYGFAVGVSAALAVGILIGLFNGIVTVKVRIPSFIVTLGTLGIVAGIARNMNSLQSVPIRNDLFSSVFGTGAIGPFTSLFIWTLIALAFGHFVMRRLRFGRHTLATGANREAARAVGINTDVVRIKVLVISATMAAFAGILLASRLAVGRHNLGENDLLTVIAAVVIGGTHLFGGRASVPGAVAGAILMATLNNGLILMGPPERRRSVHRPRCHHHRRGGAQHAGAKRYLMQCRILNRLAAGRFAENLSDSRRRDRWGAGR